VVGKVLDKVLVKLGWYWDEAKPEYQSKGYLLELVGPAKFETSTSSANSFVLFELRVYEGVF